MSSSSLKIQVYDYATNILKWGKGGKPACEKLFIVLPAIYKVQFRKKLVQIRNYDQADVVFS